MNNILASFTFQVKGSAGVKILFAYFYQVVIIFFNPCKYAICRVCVRILFANFTHVIDDVLVLIVRRIRISIQKNTYRIEVALYGFDTVAMLVQVSFKGFHLSLFSG